MTPGIKVSLKQKFSYKNPSPCDRMQSKSIIKGHTHDYRICSVVRTRGYKKSGLAQRVQLVKRAVL